MVVVDNDTVSQRRKHILAYLSDCEWRTAKEIRTTAQVTDKTVRTLLDHMTYDKLIARSPDRSGASWAITRKGLAALDAE